MRDSLGRPGLGLLAALSAVLFWPSSAAAEVRGGTAQDPQDAVPTLSGPRNVDIRSVGVSYDSSGVTTATDNDGDGFADYPLDEQCDGSSDNVEAGPACSDGLDNDQDGEKDLKDPGCRGNPSAVSEEDPKPVKSTSKVTRLRVSRKCTLDAEVSVLPNLKPKSVFPFRQVHLSVRGLSGKGRDLNVTRSLPLRRHSGYGFKRLKPGRYKVSVSYPGDPWRKSSRSKAQTFRVC